MKKVIALFLTLCMVFALCACGQEAEVAAPSPEETATADNDYQNVTITVADIYNATTSQGQALDAFKQYIEEKSGGKVKIDIYHGGELGTEAETAVAMKEGSIDLAFSGTAGIGQYIPALAVFECFYAFKNIDQMVQAVTDLYDTLDEAMMAEGFKLVGCYYDGPRQILSNKEITNIGDLNGLKLRAPGSSIYVNSITALGANAIAMPLGDVYTALQTGAIDAYEGTFDLMVNQSFYEQGKYIIMESHVYQPLFINYNLANWNKLNASTQALVLEAIDYSEEVQMKAYLEGLESYEKTLKDAGLTFLELTDRDKWAEAVAPASEEYAASYGELGQAILAEIKTIQQAG